MGKPDYGPQQCVKALVCRNLGSNKAFRVKVHLAASPLECDHLMVYNTSVDFLMYVCVWVFHGMMVPAISLVFKLERLTIWILCLEVPFIWGLT